MGKNNKKYYAVAIGRKAGIYDKWYGVDGTEAQVKGFPNAAKIRSDLVRVENIDEVQKILDSI